MIIDAHCDVISKLFQDPTLDVMDIRSGLDASIPRLEQGDVGMQCFAIWLSPKKIRKPGMQHLLACADLFRAHIVEKGGLRFIRTAQDLIEAVEQKQRSAMLTMEGADGLQGQLSNVDQMFERGVRCLGLTWNHANWAADGVMEKRQGGLTGKGRQLIERCNKLGIVVDVSHLAERGFWEAMECSTRPLVATHSNAMAVCSHPRNLTNEQIQAIAKRGGVIGMNLYPPFVVSKGEPKVDDVLRHIEAVCEQGGERAVGLGADFDGIDRKIKGLEDPSGYALLSDAIAKRYSSEQTERILYRNWYAFFVTELPK